MLASTRGEDPVALIGRLEGQGWWFEMKMDGVRAVLHGGLHPRFTNRTGRDITARYPEVGPVWRRLLGGRDVVLDGELVVLRGGVAHFPSIHRRDAQSAPAAIAKLAEAMPATFVPFDVLRLDGEDTTVLPYVARRELLVGVADAYAVFATRDGRSLWEVATAGRLEGMVAKRPGSGYRVGRGPAWVKIKTTRRGFVLASGYRPGNGARKGLGAVMMAVWSEDEQRLIEVGHVGSGFRATDLAGIQRKLDNFPTSGEPLILEVSFLELSEDGKLRHPVFQRVADEVEAEAVTMDALLA